MTAEQLLKAAYATIQATRFCSLMTVGESGQINARTMENLHPEEDLTIWIATSSKSRKLRDIQQNNQVTLIFLYTDENAYVTLLGVAHIETDLARREQLWREEWEAFFPGGPQSDDYMALRIEPQQVEVMNFARHVAPEPFGLQPAVLVRTEDEWHVVVGGSL
jgi:general stress protein 26